MSNTPPSRAGKRQPGASPEPVLPREVGARENDVGFFVLDGPSGNIIQCLIALINQDFCQTSSFLGNCFADTLGQQRVVENKRDLQAASFLPREKISQSRMP